MYMGEYMICIHRYDICEQASFFFDNDVLCWECPVSVVSVAGRTSGTLPHWRSGVFFSFWTFSCFRPCPNAVSCDKEHRCRTPSAHRIHSSPFHLLVAVFCARPPSVSSRHLLMERPLMERATLRRVAVISRPLSALRAALLCATMLAWGLQWEGLCCTVLLTVHSAVSSDAAWIPTLFTSVIYRGQFFLS